MEQLRRGTLVRFNVINLIGKETQMVGEVIGKAKEVKKDVARRIRRNVGERGNLFNSVEK